MQENSYIQCRIFPCPAVSTGLGHRADLRGPRVAPSRDPGSPRPFGHAGASRRPGPARRETRRRNCRNRPRLDPAHPRRAAEQDQARGRTGDRPTNRFSIPGHPGSSFPPHLSAQSEDWIDTNFKNDAESSLIRFLGNLRSDFQSRTRHSLISRGPRDTGDTHPFRSPLGKPIRPAG